jgi:hypothetical protein
MALVVPGQSTYVEFSPLANPGQLADMAYNEIVSFMAAEVINPGRAVEMASDGLSIQQTQQTSTTFAPVGVAILKTARESQGPAGVTGLGVEGLAYQPGEMVPVLQRGRIYAEWKGTTQTAFTSGASTGLLDAYHSSTVATDRGKFTDAATSAGAGTEVAHAGSPFRVRMALTGSGNIVELDVNLPGAA